MPLPGYREQFMAQLLPGAAAGLDCVAVGAQRDHLLWVVRAALGEILDVVHIQDRPSGIGNVLRLTRAARVLAVPFAAQQHGTARRLQAQDVHAYPRLAEPGAAIASTGSDPAQAAVLLFQRAPGYDHVAGRNLIVSDVSVREPRISQDRVIVGVLKFGRLDVLVSNAGISKIGPMADLDVDGWQAMIDVNLRGMLYGIAAALRCCAGRGHLVTTVSTAGLKIVPAQAVYAATKNAVRTLLEGLRQESTDGVLRTTAVSPGFVRTELADSIDNPEVREQIRRSRDEFAIPPNAVARAIAFAVEQPYDVGFGDITIRPSVQG